MSEGRYVRYTKLKTPFYDANRPYSVGKATTWHMQETGTMHTR